ncbi:MAG TPA: hypothetical protein PKD99_02470 [Sphingopyxis sp.]|mgnify:CR=1 FL=1|nr:hypothetical protein [Sphingopyxis sp.]HMP43942.1 hypothetical protein [Sphingopyxis sp.]HMQ20021.1 hypothetical protein [Sphingopyxis sp.]
MTGTGPSAPIGGPLKIYQGGRFVGTVPGFPVASTSLVFDVRPGDFTPAEHDGETVLIAHGSIAPGDFRCLAGFREPDGSARGPGPVAEMFDALASVMRVERSRR